MLRGGSCLSCVRGRSLYRLVASDLGGKSLFRMWSELLTIIRNSLLSAALHRSSNVGISGGHRPLCLLRLINLSMRFLSGEVQKPHQALEAYINFATTVDR